MFTLTKEKFLQLFNEFRNVLSDENSIYNTVYDIYFNIAKETFASDLYGPNTYYIHALYVAHNLQLSINRNKNINNQANLNTSNISDTVNHNLGGKEVAKGSAVNAIRNTFEQTRYGQELYSLISPLEKINYIGVY